MQDIDIERLNDSKYDLIILDYSSDGSETGEYSNADVTYMKSSGDKEKLLIAYISIGEAENYRFYWNNSWDANRDGIPDADAPKWLDIENPEWKGNYKVHYWDSGWQAIIYEYLDRIIDAGFDGIYMDIIYAHEYYEGVIPNSD
ncbi:MAG: endo alpha-1,4 polygalactosaminidase [Candidatus Jordarchaeum sp.]|uniref:endo alpha-1,4 polygalactosaminidase n=1 Tax=Candidatus Jordarchaeum sp. TaxID=2823881 RepID=UPI004049713D